MSRSIQFRPGDAVRRDFACGTSHTWVVQDPPFTSMGKLRVKSAKARTVLTTWWARGLPPGYRYVPRERLQA